MFFGVIFATLGQVRRPTQEWVWRYPPYSGRPHGSLLRLSPRAFLLNCEQLPAHYTGSRAEFPMVQRDVHDTDERASTFYSHCA